MNRAKKQQEEHRKTSKKQRKNTATGARLTVFHFTSFFLIACNVSQLQQSKKLREFCETLTCEGYIKPVHRRYVSTDCLQSRKKSNIWPKMSQKPRMSQSKKKSSASGSTDPNVRDLAEKAVFWILAHTARQTPIKHDELRKALFQTTRMEEPLTLARKILNNTFGYELVELSTKTKMYALVNQLNRHDHITVEETVEAKHMLLSIVLGYILMNRGPVDAKDLMRFLEKLDIGERKHAYFGNVNDLIFKPNATFVKDQYIRVISNENGVAYQLGERFHEEVSPRALLTFVSKMCGEDDIRVWKAQLKDIEEMEANAAEKE